MRFLKGVQNRFNRIDLINTCLLKYYKSGLVLSIALLIITAFGLPKPLFGQNTASSPTDDVIRKIRFTGNSNVKDRTLETLIRTRTNREFLGINRFTPWYYIWQLTKRFGERPRFLNRSVVAADMERIKLYYENLGYLDTRVDTSIVEYRKNRVEISFIIDEGAAYYLQEVSYSGFPLLIEPEIRNNFFINSPLTEGRINDTTFTSRRKLNYNELRTEQQRIIGFLKNNGYASADRDSVIALVKIDSLEPKNTALQFRINAGRVYRFGDVHITLAGPDGGTLFSERDTLKGKPYTRDSTAVYLLKQPEAQSKFSLLSDQIRFTPGEIFNNSLYLQTVDEFQNLGMLFINRFGLNETGIKPDFTKSKIPVYLELQTITKHRISTELFGMRRFGFGTGIGIDYTNNNVFQKAERLSLSTNASFEFVPNSTLSDLSAGADQSNLFQSFGVNLDYSVPRLNFPFRKLDDNPSYTNTRTRYGLSYNQSDQINFDINSDIQFNLRYEVDHNDRNSSFLDLIELDVVDADLESGFLQNLIEEFGIDSTSIDFQRIEEEFRPQVSSIIRYTFRSQNTDLIKRNRGYFSEYAVALGGNLPFLFDRYIVTPDTVEGNLPSLFGISDNSLSYSQFFKLSADFRRYIPVSLTSVVAFRTFAGFAHPYGKQSTIPLNRRFFAGGSNDIRGWPPFGLGPGGIDPDNVVINGGEIKLAAFAEVRQLLFSNLFSTDWYGALFTDAGNIWYGPRNQGFENTLNSPSNQLPANTQSQQSGELQNFEEGKFFFDEFYKQIAVATGFGLRLDFDFIVARVDFAFRAHDLEVGWFKNKKLFFSFGIGHSF